MSTILSRVNLGRSLTYSEIDANFTNLNTDKIERNLTVNDSNPALNVTNTNAGSAAISTTGRIYQDGKQVSVDGALLKNIGGNTNIALTEAESRNRIWILTGTLTGDVTVFVPASPEKVYTIKNSTTGAFQVSIKTPSGTGVQILQGVTDTVYSDGTNIGSITVSSGITGGGNNKVFIENDSVISQNYTVTTNRNAGTFGPVTINNGVTVTIPTGSTWTIV